MTPIAVLGAGSWGTTLANLLALKGENVRLWAYEPEVVAAVNQRHENPMFLPGIPLAPGLRAFADAREAVADAAVIVSVAPSHAVRSVISGLKGGVRAGTLVVSATKGIETDTLALMSNVFEECLPERSFRGAVGPQLRPGGMSGPADAGGGGGTGRGHRAGRTADLRHATIPGLLARRRGGGRACRRAQECHRHRSGHSRGARYGAQSSGRLDHPGARRDHAAGGCPGCQSAHLCRPGRYGRPDPDHHRKL